MENTRCNYSDITVQPARLDFVIEEGSTFVPSSQTLRIDRVTAGDLMPRWTTAVSEGWIEPIPPSGKDPKTIRVHIKKAALAKLPGTYTGWITFTGSPPQNTPIQVEVTLTVKPVEPPQPPPPPPEPEPLPRVAITYPVGGETFFVGDTVKVTWVTDRGTNATLDIYLSTDGEFVTLATDIPVDERMYSWWLRPAHICDQGYVVLCSSLIANTAKTGPFKITDGKLARLFVVLQKLWDWIKEILHI